jgi:hypothetical protein
MRSRKPAGKRKESAQTKVDWKALEVVHPDAAGIDVGGSEHWVAVSPDRDAEPVRCFDCFTADLRQMAQWLVEKGVRSVAMQSTGVYWNRGLRVSGESRHGAQECAPHLQRPPELSWLFRDRRSVPEMTHAGEYHGEIQLIRGGDHFGVFYRPPGLNKRCRPLFRGLFETVGKWKARVRRHDSAVERQKRFHRPEIDRIDSAHLPRPDGRGLSRARVYDCI